MLARILEWLVPLLLIVNNLPVIEAGFNWMRQQAGNRRRAVSTFLRYLVSAAVNSGAKTGIGAVVIAVFGMILVIAPHGNLLDEAWGWVLFGLGVGGCAIFGLFIYVTWGARHMPWDVVEQASEGLITPDEIRNQYGEGNAPLVAFAVAWTIVFGAFSVFCLLVSGWLYTHGCVAHGALVPIFVMMFANAGIALLPWWPVRALGKVLQASDKSLDQTLGVLMREMFIVGTSATPATIANVFPDKVDLPTEEAGDWFTRVGVRPIMGFLVILVTHTAVPDLRVLPWTLLILLALTAVASWMIGGPSQKGIVTFWTGIAFIVGLRVLQALGVLSVGWNLVATPLNGLVEILNGFLHPSGFWAGLGIFVLSGALAGAAFAATPKGIVGKVAKWAFATPFTGIALVTLCAALAAMSHQSIRYLPHWDPPVVQACVFQPEVPQAQVADTTSALAAR